MQASKIIFYGTPDFAATTLSALIEDERYDIKLVVTQPDRPAGRGNKLRESAVKQLATANNIPVLQPEKIKKNTESFLGEISEYGPFDVGVLVVYGQIMPVEVLDYPEQGTVNIHPSLLPRWRGAAPMRRAILAGDKETGVCIMKMEAGLDSGPVYTRMTTPINPTETAGELHDRLSVEGTKLLLSSLDKIASGELKPEPQDEDQVTYAHKIKTEEALIDWNVLAVEVSNKIRGMSPIPGAYTHLDGKRLKIFSCQVLEDTQEATPGQVLSDKENSLEIACGSGIVSLGEVQLEGKKRLPISEVLKGIKIGPGKILGE